MSPEHDRRREPLGEDQRPLRVAGGADAPLLAGEGHEELVLAGAALDAGETFVQIAAAQKLRSRAGDDGPPVAVAGGEPFRIDALELREVALQQLKERRVARPARSVERRGPAAVATGPTAACESRGAQPRKLSGVAL